MRFPRGGYKPCNPLSPVAGSYTYNRNVGPACYRGEFVKRLTLGRALLLRRGVGPVKWRLGAPFFEFPLGYFPDTHAAICR